MTIEIANRLCAYRNHHGLSQEALAEKLGVSRQAVSKWERAEASPDTDNLILLAQVYGVTLDALLYQDPAPREEQTQQKGSVSFKKGIHVHAANGDRVNIDLSGVHVDTRTGEHVHVGIDGIHVEENGQVHVHTDEDGHIHWQADTPDWLRHWRRFPWALLCVIAYLAMGFTQVLGGWGTGWLVFLTIPLYYSLGEAIAKRDAKHFCYPVLAALAYLGWGMFMGQWHPTWLVFLTIPIYYGLCNAFRRGNRAQE